MPSTLKFAPLLVLLAGCQYVPMLPGLTPYKIDIQQGNLVTQDMLAKVKKGMSKSQVRFALGTPLVVDPFHTDRWDYVYELKKHGRLVAQRHLVVVFDNDKLVRIDGDVAPAAPGANAAAPDIVETPVATSAASAPAPSAARSPAAAQPTETPMSSPAPVTGEALDPATASAPPAAQKPAPR